VLREPRGNKKCIYNLHYKRFEKIWKVLSHKSDFKSVSVCVRINFLGNIKAKKAKSATLKVVTHSTNTSLIQRSPFYQKKSLSAF
jgi:hypothetical protein